MVGVVILSHGELSEHLMKSTALLAGPMEQAVAVPLFAGESPDIFSERVSQAVKQVDTGDGVIALVDILGGTPYNTIGSLSREANIKVVTGVNMSMAMYLTLERDESSELEDLAVNVKLCGEQGIKLLQR